MPKLPPVHILAPTCVRYTFQMTGGSAQKYSNVVDVSIEADGLLSRDEVIDDFNSHICGFWQDSILSLYADVTLFTGAHWIDIGELTGRTGFLGPAAGHPTHGTAAGNQVPPNTAYLVHKLSTAQRGQKQGRMFIGDVNENSVDSRGVLSGGVKTSINTATESFRTMIGTYESLVGSARHPAAWRTVHVHKLDQLDPSTWTWSSSTIDSTTVDNLVASQRQRNR